MNSTNVRNFLLIRRTFGTKAVFDRYYGESAIIRGLEDGSIVKGSLAVSIFNNARAKVVTENRAKIQCTGFVNRNRALSGDSVFAKLIREEVIADGANVESESFGSGEEILTYLSKNLDDSKGACKVVGIAKRADQRFVCRLKPNESLVQPRDPRFPAMRLAASPRVSQNSLSLVKFSEWSEHDQYPLSSIIRLLGPEGSFAAEDDASLELAGLLSEKYTAEIEFSLRELFPSSDSVIERELAHRTDVRNTERVFTIDPPTAKDLDDAISISPIGDNLYRIGVHVADVSYFVRENSRLDIEASDRATSVYLPRQVYPMLPPYLSENLCSLLPNTDRLAFSVYFTINRTNSEIVGTPEFKRTIIRSVAQLSYDDVDAALAGKSNIPPPLLSDINLLMSITEKLRTCRIENGSISIDDRNGIEMKFDFSESGEHPVGIVFGEGSLNSTASHDSHTLIEELMVLTNKLVANKLMDNKEFVVPIVRRHLDTEEGVVEAGKNFLTKANIDCPDDMSLTKILVLAKSQLSPILYSAFTHSVLGQFNRAEYIVPETDGPGTCHWGVGASRYMHFTSPIRRYADLLVHRKMVNLIENKSEQHISSPNSLVEQIKKCNLNARAAQEAEYNNKLFYFTTFLRSFGNAGYPVDVIVKSLVAPVEGKSIKGSIVFYVPLIGDVRSQSLDSLGLELVESRGDDTTSSLTVKNRSGEMTTIKILDSMVMRAFVRKEQTPMPRFYLRLNNPVPIPPPLDSRPR